MRLRRGQGAMQGNPRSARLFADLPYPPGGLLLSLRDNSPCAAKSDESRKGPRSFIRQRFLDKLGRAHGARPFCAPAPCFRGPSSGPLCGGNACTGQSALQGLPRQSPRYTGPLRRPAFPPGREGRFPPLVYHYSQIIYTHINTKRAKRVTIYSMERCMQKWIGLLAFIGILILSQPAMALPQGIL